MSADELTIRRLDRHAAEAFAEFVNADPSLGGDVAQVADATVFRWPDVPIVLFNHAVGLGNERPPTDDEIDRILELFREKGVQGMIQLSPLADQNEIGKRLAARGLEPGPSWSVLGLTPDRWTPAAASPSISIAGVTAASREDFVRVLLESFQMGPPVDRAVIASIDKPDVYCFLARWDGEPAGCGQLLFKADVGGLFSGGVLERFRRRGMHGALIDARLRAAFDRHVDLCYSETEEVNGQSHRDLARHGFFLAYEHVNWLMR